MAVYFLTSSNGYLSSTFLKRKVMLFARKEVMGHTKFVIDRL